MQIILIVVVLIFIVVLLKVRQKSQNADTKLVSKTAKSEGDQKSGLFKKKASGSKVEKGAASLAKQADEDSPDGANNKIAATVELEESKLAQPVKVSVQEVDPLTEYKVYKEFGYSDKAAEALLSYLSTQEQKDSQLLSELAQLYLDTEKYESLVDLVLDNRQSFSHEQVQNLVKIGLETDANNLELRVLADELLNWGIDEVNAQVLNVTPTANDSKLSSLDDLNESVADGNLFNTSVYAPQSAQAGNIEQADKLVIGNGVIKNVSHEEMQALSVLLPADNALKLMRGFSSYATFSYRLDKILPKLKNPAAALIDVLGLDYQNKNLDAFARHLWELYSVLGKNGQGVKDKMLGWGYGLGNHDVLNRLAMVTTEQEIKDIGKEFGYRIQGTNSQKSLQLVNDEIGAGLGKSLGRDVNSIMQEADAYLMYGQLDEAMQVLEQGIKIHQNEPQLYVALFELYERAEDWVRLDEFSKRLRTDMGNLPEEVILVMSQLSHKLKKNNIGMVA